MTVAAGKTPRSRRGRVLIVGQLSPAQAGLIDMFAQQPTMLGSMFEALGEAAASGASDPVAAVIISEEFTRAPHQCAIESLRRIDPAIRIIGLTRSADAPAAAGGASSPDAWLSGSTRLDDLRRALDDDGLLASATSKHAPAAALPPIAAPTSAPAVFDLDAGPPPSRPAEAVAGAAQAISHSQERENVREQPQPSTAATIESAPASASAAWHAPIQTPPAAPPPPAVSHSQERDNVAPRPQKSAPTEAASLPTPVTAVGDTDLLHALLHDHAGILPLALQLIAHHGGSSNVRVIDDASSTNEGVEIIASGHRFGRLLADGVAPGRLRPWADWLGHWLHMQREHARLRELCATDDLTGARNRRFFHSFLEQAIARAKNDRRPVTVMVFDIDNFKPYNDRHGHEAGDNILCEIVRLLKSIVRQGDVVCRIGGDEFVVVFADPEAPRTPGSKHPETIESIARRIQQAVISMRFPKLGVEAPGSLSISAGLATYPWDGHDSAALLRHADERALESKRRGKNAITLGPGATGP